MKVLFAGPSLYGAEIDLANIALRPPAARGDLLKAVLDGATSIGLVDGMFGGAQSVWHKEILFGLERGVQIFGAASMGALRAAECRTYGMIPVGIIARRYCNGSLDDDAAVALLHAPAELGYTPLSIALVDMQATLNAMADKGLLSAQDHAALIQVATATHFTQRTKTTLASAMPHNPDRAKAIVELYSRHEVHLKRLDALELIARMKQPITATGIPVQTSRSMALIQLLAQHGNPTLLP